MTNTRRVVMSTVLRGRLTETSHFTKSSKKKSFPHFCLKVLQHFAQKSPQIHRSPSSLGTLPTLHPTEGKSVAKISASAEQETLFLQFSTIHFSFPFEPSIGHSSKPKFIVCSKKLLYHDQQKFYNLHSLPGSKVMPIEKDMTKEKKKKK